MTQPSAPEIVTDIAVIGAGTAGITAFAELGKLGPDRVLIDHGPLGTTCARVGCMPSKAALFAGEKWAALREFMPEHLLAEAKTNPDQLWAGVRDIRDQLAGGTAERTRRSAGKRLLTGTARFTGPDTLDVDGQQVRARAFIIATGSTPIVPGFLKPLGDKVLTTDNLFEVEHLPDSVGVIGLGAIGVEMGLALARLGVRVVGADMADLPAGITDPEIGQHAMQNFGAEMTLRLGHEVTVNQPDPAGPIILQSGGQRDEVQMILASLGRRPNIEALALDAAGVAFDDKGRPVMDSDTLRLGKTALFMAGDVNAIRPLMHEAGDEGVIAAREAARLIGQDVPSLPDRSVSISVTFSNPDIATAGVGYDQLDPDQTVIGVAKGKSDGRSRILGAEDNLLRLYVRRDDGQLIGASIFATHGEHLAHLLAWAIQRGETVEQMLTLPFYHPSIEEMIQSALKDAARKLKS